MALTADQVVVKLEADVNSYLANTAKAQQQGIARMQSLAESAAQMGNSTESAFNKAASGIDKAAKSASKLGAPVKAAAGHTANLAAQFNDIGVQLAAGTSPLTIALQQGTQINQVLGQLGGGVGSIKALAGAFLSVISPVNLATIAIIAAGGALLQYIQDGNKKVPELDEVLKEHERQIKALGPAYGEAIKQARSYIEASPEIAQALANSVSGAAKKNAVETAREIVNTVGSEIQKAGTLSFLKTGDAAKAEQVIAPVVKAFRDFKQAVADGTPDVAKFREELLAIGTANPAIKSLTDSLILTTQRSAETEDAARRVGEAYDEVSHAFDLVSSAISKIDSSDARKELEDLETAMKDGKTSTQDVEDAIQRLSGKYPDMSEAIRQVGALGVTALQTKAYLKEMSDLFQNSIGGKGDRLNRQNNSDAVTEMYRSQYQMWRRMNPEAFKLEQTLARQNKQLDKQAKKKKTPLTHGSGTTSAFKTVLIWLKRNMPRSRKSIP